MDTLSALSSIDDNLFREILSSEKRASSREFAIRSSVEAVVEDLVDMVEDENSDYEPTIGHSVVRTLFVEDDIDPVPRELWDYVDSREDSRYCSCCGQHDWIIMERIRKENGDPGDVLEDRDGKLVCLSCSEMLERRQGTDVVAEILEGPQWKCCSNCFLSEKMGLRYGITMEAVSSWPIENVCSVCLDIFPELGIQEYDTEEETYEGEYENEEPPENNSEKARKIKDTIREVGGKMFDLQEILKEGDYLEIMELLQRATNEVNSL